MSDDVHRQALGEGNHPLAEKTALYRSLGHAAFISIHRLPFRARSFASPHSPSIFGVYDAVMQQ